MLDTDSGPNIIKENFVRKNSIINYSSQLKLNSINEYSIYTLGEISLSFLGNKVAFHIVASDFPILQSGILGNDFFK